MEIHLDVPDRFLLNESETELAGRFKLSTALLMFQSGQISAGAACEFAKIDRYTFWAACKRHKIDVMSYEPTEIEEDLMRLQS